MVGTGDDSFFLSTEAGKVHRDTYRIFCVLTSVLSPAFGWIYHVTDPAALDPMWARVGMALPTLLLLLLSYANSWVKKHFIPLVHLLFYLLTAYFIGITALNSFSPNYALGVLFALTGIGVAFGLGLKTLRPLAFYLCSAVTMCLAAVWLTPQPEVSPAIMSISVVSTGLVIYVAARSRVRAEQTVAATEKRYHSLVESANDAIFIADADRDRSARSPPRRRSRTTRTRRWPPPPKKRPIRYSSSKTTPRHGPSSTITFARFGTCGRRKVPKRRSTSRGTSSSACFCWTLV